MDQLKRIELFERYKAAAHAVQSGIAMLMKLGRASMCEPKHLRVGIDTAKAEQGGLAKLLVAKGVFTEEEYHEAMAAAMEDEKARSEDEISRLLGKKVTLG